MHLDPLVGAYFDFGNHTEKVRSFISVFLEFGTSNVCSLTHWITCQWCSDLLICVVIYVLLNISVSSMLSIKLLWGEYLIKLEKHLSLILLDECSNFLSLSQILIGAGQQLASPAIIFYEDVKITGLEL